MMSWFSWFQIKPEFATVLAEKQVKVGKDVTLCFETNTERLTATWTRRDQKLNCVEGKHRTGKTGTKMFLEIKNVDPGDEGVYTVTIENSKGSASCSAMVFVEIDEWRTVNWGQDSMIKTLKDFHSEKVKELRFLLHGPVGSGKSSIINTIKTIFEGHQYINCLTASMLTGESCTKKYEKYGVGNGLPFAFYDVMGLEEKQLVGVHSDDIVNAFKGHVPDDYTFKALAPIDKDNKHFNENPKLEDQIHCLVSVISANTISILSDGVIKKMRNIRAEANKLGIPQVVIMTRVDLICKMMQQDVTKIYKSKKIKEKMTECSNRLGVSMNCIFPVKNYSEETKPNEKLNCLMLEALTQIVHSANDFVKKRSNQQKKSK